MPRACETMAEVEKIIAEQRAKPLPPWWHEDTPKAAGWLADREYVLARHPTAELREIQVSVGDRLTIYAGNVRLAGTHRSEDDAWRIAANRLRHGVKKRRGKRRSKYL